MSGNSCESALHTAPMVSALPRGAPSSRGSVERGSPPGSSLTATALPPEVGQLVLADLQLVAVLQPVRVDPPPVDVRAVQRAGVVEEPPAGAPHEHGVVARDRDVVEEDLGVRRA